MTEQREKKGTGIRRSASSASGTGTKERVLASLTERKGDYVSGEQLASELKVSRAAIWKAIRALREDGWQIGAVTNRGYCLTQDQANDRLSASGMKPYLPENYDLSLIRIVDTIDSTNRMAKQMAVSGAPSGTAVLAEMQTAGSGHSRHTFSSPRGGLYLSLLLRPEREVGRADHSGEEDLPDRASRRDAITLTVAETVSDVIFHATGKKTHVKPLNDLYLGDRKVGGILAEAGTDFDTGELEWLVIGVGINVRTRPEDFPEEIRARAGSLYGQGEACISRNRLAAEIFDSLMKIQL